MLADPGTRRARHRGQLLYFATDLAVPRGQQRDGNLKHLVFGAARTRTWSPPNPIVKKKIKTITEKP
jgi:hypothetical protein